SASSSSATTANPSRTSNERAEPDEPSPVRGRLTASLTRPLTGLGSPLSRRKRDLEVVRLVVGRDLELETGFVERAELLVEWPDAGGAFGAAELHGRRHLHAIVSLGRFQLERVILGNLRLHADALGRLAVHHLHHDHSPRERFLALQRDLAPHRILAHGTTTP